MDKLILLMKNHTVLSTSQVKKFYDNIEYIIFRVDNQLNTFILQKPNDVLLSFTKASISFEAIISQHNVDEINYNTYTHGFCKVDKEFTTLYEFIQYIHSLNRISYSNFIMNSNDSSIYEEIKFCYFKINIYKDNKRIYHYKNTANKERKFFGTKEILMDIDSIYKPFMKGNTCFIAINTVLKKWKITEKLIKECICGVPLEGTSSFVFYDSEFIKYIDDNVRGLYCQTWINDKNKFDKDIINDIMDNKSINFENGSVKYFQSVKLLDYWAVNIFTLFEYISYLPYIYMIIQTIKEINDLDEYKNIYSSKSYFELDLKNIGRFKKLPEIICTDTNVLTMNDIYYLIRGDNDE